MNLIILPNQKYCIVEMLKSFHKCMWLFIQYSPILFFSITSACTGLIWAVLTKQCTWALPVEFQWQSSLMMLLPTSYHIIALSTTLHPPACHTFAMQILSQYVCFTDVGIKEHLCKTFNAWQNVWDSNRMQAAYDSENVTQITISAGQAVCFQPYWS